MKKIITFCFDKWWRPVLFYLLATALFILWQFKGYDIFSFIGNCLFVIGLVIIIGSLTYQIKKRRWLKSTLTFVILIIPAGCIFFCSLILPYFDPYNGDQFANNLKIPTNIPTEEPIYLTIDNERPDSILSISKSHLDFQLYNSSQPGLYQYDIWVGKIPKGTIYLKAFEITHEHPLSVEYLPIRSSIIVVNTTDSIHKFGTTSDFTIYEGDWGKPYAARFEAWYKPDNGDPDQKMLSKNYIIEGWQR